MNRMNGLKWVHRANRAKRANEASKIGNASGEGTGGNIVRMNTLLRRLLLVLCVIFCVAYPIGVIGVAFDVHPPFSLAWAGSALLFLEGSILIIAMMLSAGWWRGVLAGLVIIALSYVIETIGVNTGFPFGVYYYTGVLFPALPGGVPLAVLFAWVLIIFGVYGWLTGNQTGGQHNGWQGSNQHIGLRGAVIGALLATLLDMEIEPVATHLERYWLWLGPGYINYYGVPVANFVAWFFVACVLLLLVDRIVVRWNVSRFSYSSFARRGRWEAYLSRALYVLSLFMFGLVDLTHGYYGAALMGVLAGLVLVINTF